MEALENRILPLTRSSISHLKALCHAADRPQQAIVHQVNPVKHPVLPGDLKHNGRNTLLDGRRTGTVFNFVNSGLALPFQPQEASRHRRPSEDCGIGEVKDIMEAVTVLFVRIVRQRIWSPAPVGALKKNSS